MIDFIRRHKIAFIALLIIVILSVEGYVRKRHHSRLKTDEQGQSITD